MFHKMRFVMGSVIINLAGFILAFIIILMLSKGSYHYFEKYFLNMKDKFAIITKSNP